MTLLSDALAPSTKKAYSRAWDRYNNYASIHQLPVTLPLKVEHLACFVTFLFQKGLSSSSISSTLSALSYIHKLYCLNDPTRAFHITQLMTSIRRHRPSVDGRQPITEDLLFKILTHLPSLVSSLYEKILFKAMFLFVFYFGLRVGEVTSSTHNIQFSQVIKSRSKLTLYFATYKHSPAHPLRHSLNASNSLFCPVLAIGDYLLLRGTSAGPLFLLGGNAVTAAMFNMRLRQLLHLAGEQCRAYSAHSFRIGAASYWASKGLSDVQIRRLGRWRSDAMVRYIRGDVVHSVQH